MCKDMIPKSGLSAGAVWAVKALEGLLPSMCTDVASQVTCLNELPTTIWTRVD